ncbi:MAG: amidohydrolase [Bacteroidetes bacterium]|nr:MAG: amidohydrolase [Bacteroidota bacterium]
MKKTHTLICLLLTGGALCAQDAAPSLPPNKAAVIASVERHSAELIELSDKIWAYAETAFEEHQSAKALADYAEAQGFRVERGVADLPTAFVASYGSGRPIIGILGEYDALPGISQKAQPGKEPLQPGAAGHGCGHNLFGPGSLGAAIAIKELMEQGAIQGTVRFYGTPAEEKYFGKLYMARAGLFDDLDVCLDWHPGDETKAGAQSSLALIDFIVEFYGQAAHASSDPWNGRSAADALELYTTGINYLREHIKPTVRIHYHIMQAGDVVNVVPDYAKIWTRVRDTRREGMLAVYERVLDIAEGAALMANVEHKVSLVSGLHEVLVNRTGGMAMQKNLELLGPIQYSEEEIAFAKELQSNLGKPPVGMDADIRPYEETKEHPGGGSTDVGDVSWLVPEIRLRVTTAPKDVPWHSWAVVACGGMSIGHKGMLHAAKALAMTMVDLYENPDLVRAIRKEFLERKGDYQYKAILPEGPPRITN